MSKKSISAILFILVISLSIISLYTTFAYNDDIDNLGSSKADYNLIYSLKDINNKYVHISKNEEKYVDITLINTYESPVKYGMYYQIINPKEPSDGLKVSLAPDSTDLPENIIKPKQNRNISIKIVNNSNNDIELIIGSLIGFENGNIQDLVSDNQILIK